MKESKKEVEKAVIMIAESLNMKQAVELLLINVGLLSTIKEIIYKSFVDNKQDYFEKDDKVFASYQLVRKYCNEMSDEGEVNFDVPFDSDKFLKNLKVN